MSVSHNSVVEHLAERLLLKPDEAAAALAVSPPCLWGLTKAGDIPAVRIGRAVRYDLADLRAWIEARKQRLPTGSA